LIASPPKEEERQACKDSSHKDNDSNGDASFRAFGQVGGCGGRHGEGLELGFGLARGGIETKNHSGCAVVLASGVEPWLLSKLWGRVYEG
jgi:hypothetical protein